MAKGLALWRGLRPLYALSADVAALDPTSAQRLASRHAWSEFESVVASINTLLDRQQVAMVRERRLANEVAHELRTPLSSIALQASAHERREFGSPGNSLKCIKEPGVVEQCRLWLPSPYTSISSFFTNDRINR